MYSTSLTVSEARKTKSPQRGYLLAIRSGKYAISSTGYYLVLLEDLKDPKAPKA